MTVRQVIEQLRGQITALLPRIGLVLLRMKIAIALTLITIMTIFTLPRWSVGEYIDEHLWYGPVIQLRHAFGLTPKLDPSIRIILNEDFTVGKLKRFPTFQEWTHFAKMLRSAGYEKIMFYGGHEFTFESVTQKADNPPSITAATVVAVQDKSSLATEKIEALHDKLLPGEMPHSLPINWAMTLPPRLLDRVEHIGHINQSSSLKVKAFYGTSANHLVPYMGFWVADDLTVSGRKLFGGNPHRSIPLSGNGDYYINNISFWDSVANNRDQLTFALRFYDRGKPRKPLAKFSDMSEKARNILAGGKTAIIIADSTQRGTRWIHNPVEGRKVPTYTSYISVINSVVTGRHMSIPFSHPRLILLGGILVYLLLVFLGSLRALRLVSGLIVCWTALGAYLLAFQDVYLPTASLTIVASIGLVTRFAYHFVDTIRHQATLSQQLELGSTVQSLLMPHTLAGTIGQWQYQIIYKPHGPMAGDWVQVFTAPAVPGIGPVGVLAIGDVVGKGPSAALNTAVIANVWREHAERWSEGHIDSEGFFAALNQAIFRTFGGKQNTTLSMAVLLPDEVVFLCSSAPKWHHIKPGQKPKKVMTKAHNPVGFFKDIGRSPKKGVTPEDRDLFVAYTDGVIDDAHAEHAFRKEVETHSFTGDSKQDFAYLEETAVAVGKDSALPDDITMLLIKRLPIEESESKDQDARSETPKVAS